MTSSDTSVSAPLVDDFTESNSRDMPTPTRPGALDVSNVFKLIIEDDEGKTIVFPLTEGETTIGRHEANTVRLMERNVSRRHARVICEQGEVFIEDRDSYIGVRVNGERIETRRLMSESDLVEIGDYHLALRRTSTEDEELSSQVTQALPVESSTVSEAPMALSESSEIAVESYPLPEELLSEAHVSGNVLDTTAEESATGPNLDTVPERPSARSVRAGQEPSSDLPPFPETSAEAIGAISGAQSSPTSSANAFLREPGDAATSQRIGSGPPLVVDVPRLICVSTQYAGQSYPLDQKEVVIGRVEDNDIVIEHRSVSRNHAKISGAGQEYHIADLQSANGILVNGEEFLRRG